MTAAPQRLAIVRRTPILPYDRVVDGLACLTIPNDRGFALIGDTNPGDIVRRDLRLCHYSPHRRDHCRPDFLRIMLDVARRRIDLTQLFLRGGERLERCVERDSPRRSRALVDCDESRRQMSPRARQPALTLVHRKENRERSIGRQASTNLRGTTSSLPA